MNMSLSLFLHCILSYHSINSICAMLLSVKWRVTCLYKMQLSTFRYYYAYWIPLDEILFTVISTIPQWNEYAISRSFSDYSNYSNYSTCSDWRFAKGISFTHVLSVFILNWCKYNFSAQKRIIRKRFTMYWYSKNLKALHKTIHSN